jgi:hypothetical protein
MMPASDAVATDQLKRAVWLGAGLLSVTLAPIMILSGILFWVHGSSDSSGHYQLPLAVGVLAGFLLLIGALAGLVVIFKDLGLSDPGSALGLPSGSIRALLALALVTVFVGVCSAELFDPGIPDSDTAKQILSISATALTTIIGFYFGSNAANDAFSAANQANNPDTSATPPTLDGLTHRAASIKGIADGLVQKLAAGKDPDLDHIAQHNPDATALAALRDKLALVEAQVTAAGVDRDRAAKLVADATADASKLNASSTSMQQYTADAAKAQTAFTSALADYVSARDALLATLAKG